MNAIKERKRFRDFQNYLSLASDKEREAAILIVRTLDRLPTKKKKIEILKKVIAQLAWEK